MRNIIIFIILTLSLICGCLCNLYFGAVDLSFGSITSTLFGHDGYEMVNYIVFENRFPQMIMALLGGGALAITGLMLQTAFHNPLAGPSILGISSGAGLGVAIVILLFSGFFAIGNDSFSGSFAIIIGALAGSLSITAILTLISLRVKNSLLLLIVGIMTGYLSSSIVTLLSSLSTARNIQGYVMWGMGSFSNVTITQLPWISGLLIIGLIYSISLAKPLNLLLLGDNYATNLGINVNITKTKLLVITGVLTALVTAYCGPVSFIGLAMPHVARMLAKTDNHWILMPVTVMCGSLVALICAILSVTFSNMVIPLNALTPIFGVPVILYVILKKK